MAGSATLTIVTSRLTMSRLMQQIARISILRWGLGWLAAMSCSMPRVICRTETNFSRPGSRAGGGEQ